MKATPTRALLAVVIGVTLFALAAQTQTPIGTPADRAAILKFREAHNVAWNSRNAKALANLYAPDGDRISASGNHYIGRDQIEQSYDNAFKGAYKNSPGKDESTALKFLTADVAMVDVDDEITNVSGGMTVHHHVASIYVKRNGQWDMVAERATLKQ